MSFTSDPKEFFANGFCNLTNFTTGTEQIGKTFIDRG
jgi:hypothetical protein